MAADTLAELFVKINADQKELTSSFSGIKSGLTSLASGLGSSITAALGPIGAAIAGAFAIKEMVNSFMEGELAVTALSSALKANGAEVDNNVAKFTDLAAEIQAATRQGDEDTFALITKGLNLGIPAAEVDKFTKAAVGLGTALNMGPEEAMAALAKESQGVKSSLDRTIPALKGVEDQSQRLAIIQDLAAKGMHQEEAAAQTLSGQMTQLWNGIGDLAETFGGMLAPVIGFGVQLLKDLTGIIQEVATAFTDASVDTGDLGQILRDILLQNIRLIAEVLKFVAPVVVNVFGTIVGWFNHAASASLDFWNKIQTFGVRLPDMWNNWLGVAGNVLNEIGGLFSWLGTGISDFVNFAIDDIGQFVGDITFTLLNLDLVFQEVGIFLADFVAGIGDRFNYAMDVISTFCTWLGDNFTSAWLVSFDNTLTVVQNFVDNAIATLQSMWDWVASGGTKAFDPMLKSLDDGTKEVFSGLKMPDYKDSFDEKGARAGLDAEWKKRKQEWDSITREDPLKPHVEIDTLPIIKEAEDTAKKEKEKKAKESKSDVGTFSNLGEAFKRANSEALKAQQRKQDEQLKEAKQTNRNLEKVAQILEGQQLGLA